jgi:hypothetical protein
MKHRNRFAACFLLCTAAAAVPPGQIAGIVIDTDSEEAIQHVRVTATIWRGEDYPDDVLIALTGEDGRFRFTGLPDIECHIKVEKAGYLAPSFDARRLAPYAHLRPGNAADSLTLGLTPTGALTVGVVEDSGFPVAGAQVEIWSTPPNVAFSDLPYRSTTAKDGRFLARLPRGSYRVGALSPGSGTLLRAQGRTFVPTYYPGDTDVSRPQWIDVVPGKDAQALIHVTPITAREIRGRFGFKGCTQLVISLASEKHDPNTVWGLVRCDGESGRFRISGLAPGTYTIGGGGFSKIVQVLDGDIDDLVIPSADLLPGR